MAADFELKIDRDKVDDLVSLLDGIDQGAEKALYRALKRVQSKAKTRVSQMIRNHPKHGLNLGAAYVKSKLNVGKPTYSNLTARLYASKRGTLLTRFPYRKKASGGINVKVLRKGSYKNLPGAFIMENLKNSGATGIAIRKGGKIKMLYAPSISQALNQHLPQLSDEMGEYALEALEKEVSGVLRQKGF